MILGEFKSIFPEIMKRLKLEHLDKRLPYLLGADTEVQKTKMHK